MARVVLFFILFIFILPLKQLTAVPPPAGPTREIVRLFIRLIREDSRTLYNTTLRSRMNGAVTSRRWPKHKSLKYGDEVAKSFESEIPSFLDDAFDSLISDLPPDLLKDQTLWRSYVSERFGITFSETEYKQIESILRMTKEEREELFKSTVAPMIKNWRSHLKMPQNPGVMMTGEWKRAAPLAFLPASSNRYIDYIEWSFLHGKEEMRERIVTASHFKLIRHQNGIQNLLLLIEPSRHLPLNHLPTHLRIEETAKVIELVRFEKGRQFNGFVASFSVLPHEHRFVTLSFPALENSSFSEAVIVDLWSGKVFQGVHGGGRWNDVMRGPMTDLFRRELVRLKSPLSQLLRGSLLRFKELGWHDIDDFLEMELTLLENGVFRYRLTRFDFEVGSFAKNSPVITLIIDMKNLSQPKVMQMNLESTGTRLIPVKG
jgi:hypothetical protein